jgi:hypothetical protein
VNKIRYCLHMFVPHDQQCFNHQMYSLNQISSIHFLLDSFSSFDWTPTQELETTQHGLIDLPFLFNSPDSPSPPITSPPLPFPTIPCQTRDMHRPHHLPSPIQFRVINDIISLTTTTTGIARAPHSQLL